MTVESLLHKGRANPLTATELAELLKVHKRTVFAMIHREREAGALIIGCNDGFYLAESREDLEYFEKRSKARALNYMKTGKTTRRELKKTKGQGELFPDKEDTRQDPDTTTGEL